MTRLYAPSDHACVRLLQANHFEGEQVGLPHRPLVEDDVRDVPPRLLVVHRELLDVADDVLVLESLDQAAYHLPGQDRVLALVFEIAAVSGLPRDVDAAGEGDVVALVT